MWETGRKISIVMVDDDEEDCLIIKEALAESELDHTLTICESGLELLDYLHGSGKFSGAQPECPDLILLDLYMPGIDGREVLRRIREESAFSHLDVVVLTDSTEWAELWECYQLGATGVFTKGKWLQMFAEIIRISGPYWYKFVTLKLKSPHQDTNCDHNRTADYGPG